MDIDIEHVRHIEDFSNIPQIEDIGEMEEEYPFEYETDTENES